jgi:hypothetical protein
MCGRLVYIVCGRLVYFPVLVCFDQEKSGNPEIRLNFFAAALGNREKKFRGEKLLTIFFTNLCRAGDLNISFPEGVGRAYARQLGVVAFSLCRPLRDQTG